MSTTLTAGRIRPARAADAYTLYLLSTPFMRSGELRHRPPGLYTATAHEFLVAEDDRNTPQGCLALRHYPAAARGRATGEVGGAGGADGAGANGRPAGVLHNFCVLRRAQGAGLGSLLLARALARAEADHLPAVYTATTGHARVFLRAGFHEVPATAAPPLWASALDPDRHSRILTLPLAG
ncbi:MULTISPECIES: GNAT family N-acetyltransferase [Streptacidiphilus]|uniref:GNAT family N-acetyltransferase n=1 Tax=Streptacidiphilus cavernicola TaxID=3342716 RepID=A0ABV6UQ61_9ACTN|nr:GNAT family N-acetyltransferase [Streptacidiphilus jeojiense]